MEIEAKFTIPNRETFDRLTALTALGGYELRPAGEAELVDRYYDTAERAVWRGGFALRLRENRRKGRWRGTVKGLGGANGAVHEREEHEAELPGNVLPADWPDCTARDVALRLIGAAEVEALFAVEQRRTKREIWGIGEAGDSGGPEEHEGSEGPGGRLVGEWSVDEIRWTAGGQAIEGLELEIELLEAGTPADLAALTLALSEHGLEAQPRSKFERGLALLNASTHHRQEGGLAAQHAETAEMGGEARLAPGEAASAEAEAEPPAPARRKSPGVRADEPMAEAGRQVLRFHFGRMVDNEAGARLGEDIEAVHDMRVATRRQRAALRLFGGYFKPKALRPIRKSLQAVAGRLGAVRDLDVLLEAAGEYQAGLPEATAAALQPVLDAWRRERDADRVVLLAHLDSDDYARFKAKYAEFLSTEGAGVAAVDDAHAPTLVRDLLPARLWEHYGTVRAYAPLQPGAPMETLHALRIAGKRLRYALEFFAEALDPSLRDAIKAVVALQDHLGALNDANVALGRLHAYLQNADPRPAPETVVAVGGYMRALETTARRQRRSVGRPWRGVAGKKFRRVLARAVAQL